MAFWRNESSSGERLSSSSTRQSVIAGKFACAGQPEVMRAAQKDEQYSTYAYESCCDAIRHIFGTRIALSYQNETKLFGQMLYYILTTGYCQQTFGEEYCDITQVFGSLSLPPTLTRRALFIVYQTAVPYTAERVSSKILARGISLDDSSSSEHYSSRSTRITNMPPGVQMKLSYFSYGFLILKMKARVSGLWTSGIRRWPMVLQFSQGFFQFLVRANLMLFYFEGLYYHITKRFSGIHYVFIGKSQSQRPRYHILGILLLVQLCVIIAERLHHGNLLTTSTEDIPSSSQTHQNTSGCGLSIYNEEGVLETKGDATNLAISAKIQNTETARGNVRKKCALCLGDLKYPTATSCGHVFCWNCIMEWCNEKQECPLCRSHLSHSGLACLYHSN